MKSLIKKEFFLLICSPVAIFFLTVSLILFGLLLWVFPGEYNILWSGYASLEGFFRLSAAVFIVLIPAITMRAFSEEIKNKTLDTFRTRPKSLLSLYMSKTIALWSLILLLLISTSVYTVSIYLLGNPQGNIDGQEILASYFTLFIYCAVFVSVGLFCSSLTSNQVVAFVLSIFINLCLSYGFNLLASLFSSSHSQLFISSLGLNNPVHLMQKGVLQLSSLCLLVSYISLFAVLSVFVLSHKNKRARKQFYISLTFILMANLLIHLIIPDIRFDFTSDKRYTISTYTKQQLAKLSVKDKPIEMNVYLEGDMNPGFLRLRNSAKDLLSDFKHYAGGLLHVNFINPHTFTNNPRNTYELMNRRNMRGITLNEVDREGKSSQKIIYPYAEIISGEDTLQVSFLKNITGYSAEENLNASIENLEFEFIDALRLFNNPEPQSIAFIEGHGELTREYVYDAEELLSKYYFINRGQIGNNISDLEAFRVIIIAGPQEKYSEKDKYIIDQYIMAGGRVLWLIDGVYVSGEELQANGASPSMKNDVNLDDMLFSYGVRVNPNLLQDIQCSNIYLVSGDDSSSYIEQPWYYSPLLFPSLNNAVTKDVSLVKASFASSIDLVGNPQDKKVEKNILLTTSNRTHIVDVPEMIKIDLKDVERSDTYFNQSYLPVAVTLEGSFSSAFENRFVPDSIDMEQRPNLSSSTANTKMAIVSSSDIIKNGFTGYNGDTHLLPMGFDRVSQKQFGNRSFIVNLVNWLATDNNELFALREKQQQIRLLNKQLIYENGILYSVLNVLTPLLLASLLVFGIWFYRRQKYSK